MGKVKSFAATVFYSIKRIAKRFDSDNLTAYAAQSAFFIFISIFPFLMLFLNFLKYIPVFNGERFDSWALDFLSPQISELLKGIIQEALDYGSGALISITTVAALWACSKGVLGIIYGLNSIYKTTEKRGYIQLRIVSVIYTVGLIAALVVVLILMVFGNRILDFMLREFPVMNSFANAVRVIRWLVAFGILILFFLFLYTIIPERKTKFKNELPGAVVSAVGWIGFSALYSFYIDNFGNQSKVYGSLTAIVLFLLWMYTCMIILFAGAEINDMLRVYDFKGIMGRRRRIRARVVERNTNKE